MKSLSAPASPPPPFAPPPLPPWGVIIKLFLCHILEQDVGLLPPSHHCVLGPLCQQDSIHTAHNHRALFSSPPPDCTVLYCIYVIYIQYSKAIFITGSLQLTATRLYYVYKSQIQSSSSKPLGSRQLTANTQLTAT